MSDGRTRRLFFALWPDDLTRASLARAAKKTVKASGGRPVSPANYHVTLAFLGAVRADLVARITAIRPVAAAPEAIRLARYGYWPRPRVLWAGPRLPCPGVTELADAIWCAVEPLGLARERRALVPHVTLARKAAGIQGPLRSLDVVWPVRDFALVESVPCSRATYRVLARYDLGARVDKED